MAARAAAFEHRIAACILDDGVYDIFENYTHKLFTLGDAIKDGNVTFVNTAVETSMILLHLLDGLSLMVCGHFTQRIL